MRKLNSAAVFIFLFFAGCSGRGDMYEKMSEDYCDTCSGSSFYITSSSPDLSSVVSNPVSIMIYFNNTIDAASVGSGTFTILPTASLSTPAVSGNSITCTANSLISSTTYTVTLNGPVYSTSGLSFTDAFSLSFTPQ